MEWVVPKYDTNQVNKAGKALAHGTRHSWDYSEDYEIISNWRSSHNFPMNTLYKGLEDLAERTNPGAIVARRLKRIPAMIKKLRRLTRLKLSAMQDIGGCRVVLGSIAEVKTFSEAYKTLRRAHRLAKETNYIEFPKPSGYRGVHLIYHYTGRKELFSGYSTEIQIRTRLQHAWATAVETVGTFLEKSLKSSEGPTDWLRFFSLVGSGFAHLEDMPTVPGTPADKGQLRRDIEMLADSLQVRAKLEAYERTIRIQDSILRPEQKYFVLVLNSNDHNLSVTAYEEDQFPDAVELYKKVEEENADQSGVEAVLCSVQKIAQLQAAYPNYFHDTKVFLAELDRLTED